MSKLEKPDFSEITTLTMAFFCIASIGYFMSVAGHEYLSDVQLRNQPGSVFLMTFIATIFGFLGVYLLLSSQYMRELAVKKQFFEKRTYVIIGGSAIMWAAYLFFPEAMPVYY